MRLTLRIDRLSQLGEGVAAFKGRSVFVPGALPGEKVAAEVVEEGKVLRGQLLEVKEPSPHRRGPACVLADRCGGCDWLHVDEGAQREAKTEIVLSALEHLAGIGRDAFELKPWVVAPRPMAYRRRASMHWAKGQLGFYEHGSHRCIAVEYCPAMVDELGRLPAKLSPLLAPIARDSEAVHLLAEGARLAFAVSIKGPVSERHRAVCEAAVRGAGAAGAVLVPKEGSAVVIGDPVLSIPAPLRPELTLFERPDAFVQANGALAEGLVGAAIEAIPSSVPAALELYSGNGNFTFALAARAGEVVAVEEAPVSIELARRSARQGGVANVRFIQGDALKVAQGLAQEGRRFEAILADPPRTGAARLAPLAAQLGARSLVYVACDATALARDAKALIQAGYRPRTLQLVDMFPQTRHVEAVMVFARVG